MPKTDRLLIGDLLLGSGGLLLFGSFLGPWSRVAGVSRSGVETWQLATDLAGLAESSTLRWLAAMWILGALLLVAVLFLLAFAGPRAIAFGCLALATIAWAAMTALLLVSNNLAPYPVGLVVGFAAAAVLICATSLADQRKTSL